MKKRRESDGGRADGKYNGRAACRVNPIYGGYVKVREGSMPVSVAGVDDGGGARRRGQCCPTCAVEINVLQTQTRGVRLFHDVKSSVVAAGVECMTT